MGKRRHRRSRAALDLMRRASACTRKPRVSTNDARTTTTLQPRVSTMPTPVCLFPFLQLSPAWSSHTEENKQGPQCTAL